MNPVSPPAAVTDYFWGHMPGWVWPIIVLGIVGFFLYQAVKASSLVAQAFGKVGRYIHGRSTSAVSKRTLRHVERIEDNLDCAMTYLVDDADWHLDADMIIAERCPKVHTLLPARIPYTEYQKRWRDGWRPAAYTEG